MGDVLKAKGRLARLPYFGYLVLNWFVLMAVVVVTATAVSGAGSPAIGGIVMIAAVAACAYLSVTLIIRRLHDMDMSGFHAIWIMALNIAAQIASKAEGEAAVLIGLAAFGVALWLLLTPGTPGVNRWDPQPGKPEDPVEPSSTTA